MPWLYSGKHIHVPVYSICIFSFPSNIFLNTSILMNLIEFDETSYYYFNTQLSLKFCMQLILNRNLDVRWPRSDNLAIDPKMIKVLFQIARHKEQSKKFIMKRLKKYMYITTECKENLCFKSFVYRHYRPIPTKTIVS